MNIITNCVFAFLIGGAICGVGQVLIDVTKLTPARILTAYVVFGVFLTSIGVYEPLVNFAQAGATVPLTGFGYSLAKGVELAVDKYGLIGALSGGLTATSAGVAAAIIFALLMALIFNPGDKS